MSTEKPPSPIAISPKHSPSLLTKVLHLSRIQNIRKVERSVFKYGNRFLMIPLLRLGLGRFMSSPATGYFLLLQTTGRKSRQPRLTPLNYAIDDGCVICLAGFGEQAHWLANIRNDPHVQVQLPDRVVTGIATEVNEQAEARRLAVQVARNCGFALVFEHPRCLLMSDAQLAAQLKGRPVVRIEPVGAPLVAGRHDPGGHGWILPMLVQCLALLAIITLRRQYRHYALRHHRIRRTG
ncbi:MAG TPA: nitroreductase family deazaflavin-dependent oxidoreductase [Roseiflexaceae bacterium]|nr:nitroreductase family deazaflavin-dependent oxidoreductase [Roseiflexaceae bacterium]